MHSVTLCSPKKKVAKKKLNGLLYDYLIPVGGVDDKILLPKLDKPKKVKAAEKKLKFISVRYSEEAYYQQ